MGAWGGPDLHAPAGLLDALDSYVCQVRYEIVDNLMFTYRA